MKIYNVSVYGIKDNELRFIDKIMISKSFNKCREIATNKDVKLLDFKKKDYYTCGNRLIAKKSSIRKSNRVSNFILDTRIVNYGKEIVNSRFSNYMKNDLDENINISDVNDNLLAILNKKVKKLKIRRDYDCI